MGKEAAEETTGVDAVPESVAASRVKRPNRQTPRSWIPVHGKARNGPTARRRTLMAPVVVRCWWWIQEQPPLGQLRSDLAPPGKPSRGYRIQNSQFGDDRFEILKSNHFKPIGADR